jgi:uncharacterized protein with FMN-binding domain
MATTVPAQAAAAPGQDVLNDYGQSDAEVAVEVARAVDTTPAVITARSRAAAAHQLAVARTAAEAKARAVHRAAVKHKHRKAAAKALRVYRRAHTLAVAARSADAAAKTACARTVASTTAAIRAKHYRPVDGTYSGKVAQYFIGEVGLEPIQVRIVVYGGHVSDITVPQYVNTGESGSINRMALPILMQRAMAAHDTATVAAVSGASLTSEAFVKSLSSALVGAGFKG